MPTTRTRADAVISDGMGNRLQSKIDFKARSYCFEGKMGTPNTSQIKDNCPICLSNQ